MNKSSFGITKEPFNRVEPTLLTQQKEAAQIIKIHSHQGGFSVINGSPGAGKTILRQHIETLGCEPDVTVVAFSRTMHTYINILKQIAQAFEIEVDMFRLRAP